MKNILKALLISVIALTPAAAVPAYAENLNHQSSQISVNLKTNLPSETLSQKNAKAKAQSYLRYQAFSRQGLIEQLQYEGFSLKDSKYAVDKLKINWNAQAKKKAASYLRSNSFSKVGLVDQLIYEGFTASQANFGVNNNKVNWNTQAAKKAKSYLRSGSFSWQSLYDQLIYEGFTSSQATYGVNQTGL